MNSTKSMLAVVCAALLLGSTVSLALSLRLTAFEHRQALEQAFKAAGGMP